MPFVSVVVPTYNSHSTVADCLSSLAAQSYPRERYEIIVGDNGSTDGTLELIAARFPDVVMTQASRRGSAYARNAGLEKARGELILSTDADCVADVRWMETLVEAFRAASPQVAAIGGRIAPFRLQTLVEKYRKAWVSQPDAHDPNSKVRYTATPNAAFRAAAIRQLGGFDGSAGHDDSDLGIRFEAAGYRLGFTDQAIVRHRNPVTMGELYRHRYKYGERNFILACRHPGIFGDPRGAGKRRELLVGTMRRLGSDMMKLPLSMASRREGLPAGWPVVDAVMAVGNYCGFVAESKKEQRN